MAHYLDHTISDLMSKVSITLEHDKAIFVRGECGGARVWKRRVYFFSIGDLRSDGQHTYGNHREAKLAGLEWAVKGRI